MRYLCFLILCLFCSQKTFANGVFVGSREGDPESIVQNVSAIHGEYSELEVDLCVSGPDTLTLSRFYTSKDSLDIATFGGWRFLPQTFFLIRPDPEKTSFKTHQGAFENLAIFVGMSNGSFLKFSGFQNWANPQARSEFFVDLEENESGICNTAKGSPLSWTNVKNHTLYYYPQDQLFELHLSSGGKRVFTKRPNQQFHLSLEILPSGNRISYQYDEEHRVKQIKMKNAANDKVISWITFDYNATIVATASDGTRAEYTLAKDSSGSVVLAKVQTTTHPTLDYQYEVKNNQALLVHKELPEGKHTKIDYEHSYPYRVATLSSPIGSTHFIYKEEITEVQGPLGQRTLYHYDKQNRLSGVEETLNDTPYRIKRKKWGQGKDQGNIIASSIEDHAENVLYYQSFSYDIEGNIIEEKEYGNLTGQNLTPVAFTKRGSPKKGQECNAKKWSYEKTQDEDIVSQVNAHGNGTLIAYIPGTPILKRKEVHQNHQAKRRTYYDYSEEGALICITEDNGNTRDQNDVDYVQQKFITEVTPKQELPNLGAPEIIEEKAYKGSSDHETLIKKTVNHFDSRGLVIKQDIYDKNDAYTYSIKKSYDESGRCIEEIDPLGTQTSYAYDLRGNLVREKTLNRITEYTYDTRDNLTSVTRIGKNCSDQKTEFAYDSMGNRIMEIDSLGSITIYRYDALGRLVEKKAQGANQTWSYEYDLFDHPIVITDPLKNTTTTSYNVRGSPTHITKSNGPSELFTYSLEGSLYRHITPEGITRIFSYDYLGRTTNIKYYGKSESKYHRRDAYHYNAFQLTSESSSKGDIQYIYNNEGKLERSIKAQKDEGTWWCDGRVHTIENGAIIDFAYDSLGHLATKKSWKDKSHYTLYLQSYDLLGRVVEENIEDEQGKHLYKKKYTYAPSGELLCEIGFPNNQERVLAEYAYDALGRLSKVKKGNNTWSKAYEEKAGSSKGTTQNPLRIYTEKEYNHLGLLTSCTRKSTQNKVLDKEILSYDRLNNLTQEKKGAFTITYGYTPSGQCNYKSVTPRGNNSISQVFKHNSYGQLTHQTTPHSDANIEYAYDSQGHLKRIQCRDTEREDYTDYILKRDEKGDLIEITQKYVHTLEKTYNRNHQTIKETTKDRWGKYTCTYVYDGEGCLTKITLPDTSTINYSYEGPFVTKISRISKEGKIISAYEVKKRDLMGNITQEILPGNIKKESIYDEQGQKTEIFTDILSDKITFDPLGNPIIQETKIGNEKHTTHFAYDGLSQLTSEKGCFNRTNHYDLSQNPINKEKHITCEYDTSGNLTTLTTTTSTLNLQFDTLGRLVSTQTPNKKTRYNYDPDFRRLSKIVNDNEQIERYFYLGTYELGAIDRNGNITALRIPTDPNSPHNTTIISIELENKPYTPIADLHNNIRCLIDPKNHEIVEKYHFSAFGEEQIFTPTQNPWRYKSKRHESETGLIYYGARYYHPDLQKWISPDPLGSVDSINLYQYCHNNPLKYHDTYGLSVSISADCECANHDHPGYYNRPAHCICICGKNSIGAKIITITDGIANTWNDPRIQGGLQAIGGLVEASAGSLATLGTGGFAAPIGSLVLAHGCDQLIAGLTTMVTGAPQATLTEHLLQNTGMPATWSTLTNNLLSLSGTMGSTAITRASTHSVLPFYGTGMKKLNLKRATLADEVNNPKPIWSYTKKNTSVQNAYRHWKKHKKDFPGMLNSKQYVQNSYNLFSNRNNLLTKIRPNGDIVVYDAEKNVFGAFTSEGVPKTMFSPTEGITYWIRN